MFEFYDKMYFSELINTITLLQDSHEVVKLCCFENEIITEKVAIVFLKGINRTFATEISTYIYGLIYFLLIKDSL